MTEHDWHSLAGYVMTGVINCWVGYFIGYRSALRRKVFIELQETKPIKHRLRPEWTK